MFLDAGALSPEASYRLSSGIVVPRPIAWITTVSADGVIHLAPFSCVTFVSNKPPLPSVNIGDAPRQTGAEFIVGAVMAFHLRDGPARAESDLPHGGPNYTALGEIVTRRSMPQTPQAVMNGCGG